MASSRASRCRPARSKHDCVELALREEAQARIDVAAHRDDVEVLARRAQLGGAADAARADAGARRQRSEVGRPAKHILDARPRGRPQQCQAVRELAGEVLGRVHSEVDLTGEQRVLDRVHPARLVATARPAVSARSHGDDVGPAVLANAHRSAIRCVWASASALPRVPMRRAFAGSVGQPGLMRQDEPEPPARAGRESGRTLSGTSPMSAAAAAVRASGSSSLSPNSSRTSSMLA